MRRSAVLLLLFLLLLLCLAAVPTAAWTLTRKAEEPVRVLVVPLPGERELLLITTPCNHFRMGSASVWIASYRGNELRMLKLSTWPERQAVLGSGWLRWRLFGLPTAPPCAV